MAYSLKTTEYSFYLLKVWNKKGSNSPPHFLHFDLWSGAQPCPDREWPQTLRTRNLPRRNKASQSTNWVKERERNIMAVKTTPLKLPTFQQRDSLCLVPVRGGMTTHQLTEKQSISVVHRSGHSWDRMMTSLKNKIEHRALYAKESVRCRHRLCAWSQLVVGWPTWVGHWCGLKGLSISNSTCSKLPALYSSTLVLCPNDQQCCKNLSWKAPDFPLRYWDNWRL